jgi:hypothetical protein
MHSPPVCHPIDKGPGGRPEQSGYPNTVVVELTRYEPVTPSLDARCFAGRFLWGT